MKGVTVFISLSALSMALAVFSGNSILAILVIAGLFSLAVQGVGVLSQAQLFALSGTERSRLNTAFVVSNFLFCAAGSSLATLLWNLGTWKAVALGGVIASIIALCVHLYEARKAFV